MVTFTVLAVLAIGFLAAIQMTRRFDIADAQARFQRLYEAGIPTGIFVR